MRNENDHSNGPSPGPIPAGNEVVVSRSNNVTYSFANNQRGKEIHLDSENRPTFTNIRDDFHLLENLMRYAKVCDHLNVNVTQMANSLARAIGIQNKGQYNVLVYDYLLAIPQYPLSGPLKWCNMVSYKDKLFGVAVFPATDHMVFYFPEFSSYNREVQELIFSYGNKNLRYCPERLALAFDFVPLNFIHSPPETLQPILLTATLKRKLSESVVDGSSAVKIVKIDPDSNLHQNAADVSKPDYIQLE